MNLAICRLDERIPPLGGTGALVLQPPHACAQYVARHDRGGYYGANSEDAVSDDYGSNQRCPRRDFFDHHGAGHGVHHGGGAEREDDGLGKMKITILEFKGRADPEAYLE